MVLYSLSPLSHMFTPELWLLQCISNLGKIAIHEPQSLKQGVEWKTKRQTNKQNGATGEFCISSRVSPESRGRILDLLMPKFNYVPSQFRSTCARSINGEKWLFCITLLQFWTQLCLLVFHVLWQPMPEGWKGVAEKTSAMSPAPLHLLCYIACGTNYNPPVKEFFLCLTSTWDYLAWPACSHSQVVCTVLF